MPFGYPPRRSTTPGRMTGMSLLLLDGASMWFRSYFGVPSSIKGADGRPVNAVRGFLDAVATLVTREQPSRLVVCRDDDWRPPWRVERRPRPASTGVRRPGRGQGALSGPLSGEGDEVLAGGSCRNLRRARRP